MPHDQRRTAFRGASIQRWRRFWLEYNIEHLSLAALRYKFGLSIILGTTFII
jgi:hypothetical protein